MYPQHYYCNKIEKKLCLSTFLWYPSDTNFCTGNCHHFLNIIFYVHTCIYGQIKHFSSIVIVLEVGVYTENQCSMYKDGSTELSVKHRLHMLV